MPHTFPALTEASVSLRRLTPDHDSGSGPAVLCFPHAGGCASFFRSWPSLLPAARVDAVQYPCREDRIAEDAPGSLVALAASVAEEILRTGERYCVLFGHSMGAYVAFEVAHRLEQAGAPVPALVLSSSAAPAERPAVPFEDTADVLAYLEQYEPVSPEIRAEPELLDLILDYIKGDLRLVAQYAEHSGKRLTSRITAVVGEQDVPGIREHFTGWSRHTTEDFTPLVVPGGHFYLREQPPAALLRVELDRLRRETR
ncbi:thioesterase II family protein [Streptomyces sp. NPDC058221]|uniref:thioesterase II family protein n=1 Tax=Streptomyces sp. NPDC058221 TaxID=3346388 RepID=UPI0036EB8564